MDGVNFEGPAPRPLERFRLYVDASGDVIVDRSVKFRQDLKEWGRPEAYIKMG
jgi:cytochrome b6-f complex iron-sulfur subunit